MKEYVERQKLFDALPDVKEDKQISLYGAIADFMVIASSIPSADVVEVRHGEWHYNPDGMDWGLGAWECSLCRCTNQNLPMDEKINPRVWAGAKYCPNCGAKMHGERNNSNE